MVLIWVNATIQPGIKIPKNNNTRGVFVLSNYAIQLGPEDFLSSHIFRGVLYSTGCIDGENCNRVWVSANRNLAYSGGVSQKTMDMGSKRGRDKKAYAMVFSIGGSRM